MSYKINKHNALFTQAASVTVANTTTETTLLSATGVGGVTVLNDSVQVGKTFKVTAYGVYSTTSTPTLQIKLKLGGVTLLDSGTPTLSAETTQVFKVEAVVSFRVVGASGTTISQGLAAYSTSTLASLVVDLPNTTTVAVDTTDPLAFDLTAKWGTASTSNTITLTNLVIEELN